MINSGQLVDETEITISELETSSGGGDVLERGFKRFIKRKTKNGSTLNNQIRRNISEIFPENVLSFGFHYTRLT